MKLLLDNWYFKSGLLILTLIVCCIPLFARLGDPPIYMWDEATYANNSLDMYLSGDPIVVRMEGQPDLYNTKPPFVLWMQSISLHIFGWNEWAIRFPSAVFAMLTVLLLLWFSLVLFQSIIAGVFSILTLVCANGYVTIHVTRSGDLDATLVFWITLYVLIFLKFLLKPAQSGLHIWLVALGLTGAFFTKGIAGWFFLPLLIIVALLNGSLLKLLRLKESYLAAVTILCLSGSYYCLRETMAPGYWGQVYSSELMRFNNAVMSWHVQPFDFYLMNMLHGRFTPFLFILPLSLLTFFFEKEKMIRHCMLYLWVLVVGYFLLISYPHDKLEWYDAPLYPLLSLMIGLFIKSSLESLNRFRFIHERFSLRIAIIITVLVSLWMVPYYKMLSNVLATDEINYPWDPNKRDEFRITGAFMKYLKSHNPEVRDYTILKSLPLDAEHFDQFKFYQRTYHLKDHYSIQIQNVVKKIKQGEIVLMSEKLLQDSLYNNWSGTLIASWKGCDLFMAGQPKTRQ